MVHFVTSWMNQNKSRKQTLESAQYGREISFKITKIRFLKILKYAHFFNRQICYPVKHQNT